MPDPGLPRQQKTGEQLLSMFRQLIVVGHGLIPTRDWEAMICYVRWADMLWLNSYRGLVGCQHMLVQGRARRTCRGTRVVAVAHCQHMPLPSAWGTEVAAPAYASICQHMLVQGRARRFWCGTRVAAVAYASICHYMMAYASMCRCRPHGAQKWRPQHMPAYASTGPCVCNRFQLQEARGGR